MELEEEITELEKRFSEAPESRLFLPLADALARAGELERALELCRKGLETYPDFSAARVLVARCLAELDRREEAERLFGDILTADQGNVVALKRLGDLAQDRGDDARAFSLYRKAFALNGEDMELSKALAALEQEQATQGKKPQKPAAVAEGDTRKLDEELMIDYKQPGEVFITHTLADIYRLQGHFERSRRIYAKLLEQDAENETLKRLLDEVSSRITEAVPTEVLHSRESARSESEAPGAQGEEAFDLDSIDTPAESPKPAAAGDELTGRVTGIFNQLLGIEELRTTPAGGSAVSESWGDLPEEYLESLERWLENLKKSEAR